MPLPDYYRILGVNRTANLHEIKAAYRRLALRYHPDLHPNNPRADEFLKAINQAYDVLGDARLRQQYDAQTAPPAVTPRYTPPRSPAQTPYYQTTSRHHASASSYRGYSAIHRKTVLTMWIVGLLAVAIFGVLFGLNRPTSQGRVWRQLELGTSTPYTKLLFVDTLGMTYTSHAMTPKERLTAGQIFVIDYKVATETGRVFIGIKGNTLQPGKTAPFAGGQWIGQGQGTLKIPITETDDYVVFLNLDQFAGGIKINWSITDP